MRRTDGIKYYLANVVLIWIVLYFYFSNNYYIGFISATTKTTLLYLAILYSVLGLPMHLISYKNKSKGYIIFAMLFRIGKEIFTHKLNWPKISKEEKVAILFFIVKVYFLPVMLNFFFNNYNSLGRYIPSIFDQNLFDPKQFIFIIFPFMIALIFTIDTLFFSFGYAVETGFLKNKVRSVDPTFFGWLVALLSYPPLNGVFTKYVEWYPNDFVEFGEIGWTVFYRILILILLLIYLSATFALGAKCSNLTNRGIVSRGPYKVVRHPAYIAKNLAWWITLIPIMNITIFFSMAVWSLVYYFRTVTEERHLITDPDYVEYCKKVKYRFLPGVY